jgi:hypothetical protein
MPGRRTRPQMAAHLRRSRVSPEVILGQDAPAPAREASRRTAPEDGTSSDQTIAPRRSKPKGTKMFGRGTTPAASFLIY